MNKNDSSKITIYTPESQIRVPRRLIRSMWNDLKDSKELSWRLFIRDLSAQYRQSLFGALWAFLPPIITSLIFIGSLYYYLTDCKFPAVIRKPDLKIIIVSTMQTGFNIQDKIIIILILKKAIVSGRKTGTA